MFCSSNDGHIDKKGEFANFLLPTTFYAQLCANNDTTRNAETQKMRSHHYALTLESDT
jgi:hypothetical protein